MNITGSATIQSLWTGASGVGALYTTAHNLPFVGGQNSQTLTNALYLDASKSWTGATSEEGKSQAFNVLQPYISVYIWKRTA